MAPNILDPSAILARLPELLPSEAPSLQSPQDGLAALIHTIHTLLDFRLIAVDETSQNRESVGGVLPQGWNARGPSEYTLKYRHEQSSLVFLIKIVKLASKSLIHAISLETDKTISLDVLTADYLSSSFFPYEKGSSNPLVHGFIASNRVQDFVSLYKINIVQKLVPGLSKEGYQETSSEPAAPPATSTTPSSSSNPNPNVNPAQPRRPQTPPYPSHQPFHLPRGSNGQNPLSIGSRDLDPIPNPFAPPSLFGPPGGGMFVGPDDPIFHPGGVGGRAGPRGPWGGDGYLPPLGAPPGARFDPIGPGLGPFGPGGLGRAPRGPGGPFAGGPDNDEFLPPGGGHDDMYM